MLLLLYISLALLVGWFSRPVFLYVVNRNRIRLQRKHGVEVKPGESSREQYQKYKEGLNLEPVDPPSGTPLEAAERFKKLSPMVQRQVLAARKAKGLDNG